MGVLGQHGALSEFAALAWSGDHQLGGLGAVVMAIAEGSCKVNKKVRAATLANVLGVTGETNVHGEMVQRLDSASSDIFVEVLRQCGHVAAIGCEEIEEPVIVADDPQHVYTVLMDPLDGSSNIDVAVSIGSIFGIWRKSNSGLVTSASLLQPGNEQVAAVYVLYGSSTVLVLATRSSVQGFTLDPETGMFAMTHPDIRIPKECPYYSTNEGNFKALDETTQRAIINLRDTYSQRYVGSLVADFHRNLLKGGVFLYPADRNHPAGKLRLMYEANPLGFIAEHAGGAASTGEVRILDIMPEHLHQCTPLLLGNRDVVEHTVSLIRGH